MATKILTQIILRKNDLLLVEWLDGEMPMRAWVTPDMILSHSGKEAIVENPRAGIPYGMEWRQLVLLHATPIGLEAELKKQGIWTISDLRTKTPQAVSAIQSVYGVEIATLLNMAKAYESTE